MVCFCGHREAHATYVWLEDSSQELVLSIHLIVVLAEGLGFISSTCLVIHNFL